MKLNWAERLAVNNPLRVMEQRFEMRWMKRQHLLQPGSVVLEVGCGRGAAAAMILEEFRPALLHAQDLDERMIRLAGRRLTAGERRHVLLYVGDVLSLPYPDETLDAVFCFGVLHHVVDWRSALGEIARVLKPAGIYYLEELYPSLYQNFVTKHILLHPTEDRFHSEDFRKALAKSRFTLRSGVEHRHLGILGVAVKESP
jgi:ubiquinone/menaquinone biosynthesis C-methylase UbiE